MEKIRQFFRTFYSFCVSHKREIFISLMAFFIVLAGILFIANFSSCRGLWTMDFKGESEKGSVTTKINYVDNDIASRCDDSEKEN